MLTFHAKASSQAASKANAALFSVSERLGYSPAEEIWVNSYEG